VNSVWQRHEPRLYLCEKLFIVIYWLLASSSHVRRLKWLVRAEVIEVSLYKGYQQDDQ
jgi:hypothetical protein